MSVLTNVLPVKKSSLAFPILSFEGPTPPSLLQTCTENSEKKGTTVGNTVDRLVAHIAIEHEATLLRNDRDFDAIAKICDLRLYKH
jgi:hypothetical protein